MIIILYILLIILCVIFIYAEQRKYIEEHNDENFDAMNLNLNVSTGGYNNPNVIVPLYAPYRMYYPYNYAYPYNYTNWPYWLGNY